MSLQTEIDARKMTIHSDSYPMSIGELMSMYQAEELDIHPEFQRLYRWNETQKSKLIESILLGIPIPPIFVSQREDGVWDVIDGVQRLGTIFEFVGLYIDEAGRPLEGSALTATQYLPSLDGIRWQNDEDPEHAFSQALRLIFKRGKLDIVMIKKESEPNSKFDMFQRLNTLGSRLSDQEVRNCLLVMINRGMFTWLKDRAETTSFRSCISLSERLFDEKYDWELVLRFLVLLETDAEQLRRINDFSDFLTNAVQRIAENAEYDFPAKQVVFAKTFELLDSLMGDNCFKRYDATRDKYIGAFTISAFEVIAVGLATNIDYWYARRDDIGNMERLRTLINTFWGDLSIQGHYGMGVRASTRISHLVPFGKRWFHNETAHN